MAGADCLAGIGFTMALFISGPALTGELLDASKVGIIGGSVLSAGAGMTLLVVLLPKPSAAVGADDGQDA
jgi:NhaA family Na+:H+ antiporter